MHPFLTAWQRFHPNSTPVSHALKDEESDHWLRVHSLPKSKRYAETEEEVATILHRQNTLAEDMLGEGSPCWVIGSLHPWDGTEDGDGAWREAHQSWFRQLGMEKVHHAPDPYDPEITYDVFAARTIWHAGAFDKALQDIADDRLRLMWMSERTGAIFAPYDGGVDLILPSFEDLRTLILSHSDWLSSGPRGC